MSSGSGDGKKRSFEELQERLQQELTDWFEKETQPIDGSAPPIKGGVSGTILMIRPAISSKRVLDATCITEEVLGISLPPEIIKPGGYQSLTEMLADIIPKLKKVYTGELKVKQRRATSQGNSQ